jgi:hypothetical protein
VRNLVFSSCLNSSGFNVFLLLSVVSGIDFFFFLTFRLLSFHFLNFDLGQDIVNAICDDEDIKAISFVGPNVVSYSLVLKH